MDRICKKAEWLSFYVNEEDLKRLTKEEYIAHCLSEMTYLGFSDEDIDRTIMELDEIVHGIEDGTIETFSAEEVFDNLNDIIEEFKNIPIEGIIDLD